MELKKGRLRGSIYGSSGQSPNGVSRDELHDLLQPDDVQHPNYVEHQSYENLPELLKQDVDQLITYDRLLRRLLASSRPESSSRTPSARSRTETKITTESSIPSTNKPVLPGITAKDLDKLCEFMRMDKGLPLTHPPQIKKIDVSKPSTLPKVNRATILRDEHTKRNILMRNQAEVQQQQETVPKITVDPLEAFKEAAKRAKEEAKKRKKLNLPPLMKTNRLYNLRYQHNKGEPLMPVVFKQSYENFRKPPFKFVRRLQLPMKYLQPVLPKNSVSILGLSTDPMNLGFSAVYREKIEKPDVRTPRQKARPKLKKGKHVLRRTRTSMRTGKRPWNYGTYRRDNRWRV